MGGGTALPLNLQNGQFVMTRKKNQQNSIVSKCCFKDHDDPRRDYEKYIKSISN